MQRRRRWQAVGSRHGSRRRARWEHDRFGNRIAQVATAGNPPVASPAIDPATNRIAAAGFAFDAGGALSKEHVYAGSELIATRQGATVHYHHGDHLSARLTTDETGQVVGERGHYPYGEPWYGWGEGQL